jgi:predicted short-subunit dehydrogenase-like oxidoreductase (DUF2520 family)
MDRTFALVGPGRAGNAVGLALIRARWTCTAVAGRGADAPSTRAASARLGAPPVERSEAGRDAGVVIIATPDSEIAAAAADLIASLAPAALVVHLSGAVGVDALEPVRAVRPDVETGALHPLQSLPNGDLGAARLPGSWCGVEGGARVEALASEIGLRPFPLDAERRRLYHAAASVAANHLVALLGQLERLAAAADVPFEAFLGLARAVLDNVAELGPAVALTGPVARGDAATVAAHLAALPPEEQATYRALAREALRLSGRDDEQLEAVLDDRAART